jgi:formiminotetrahydrofolate cyclodeaminase
VQYERELSGAIVRLTQLREELKTAIDADAASYDAVVKAYKQAKDSANGDTAVTEALKGATLVPLTVVERAREVADLAQRLRPMTNPRMASDLVTSAALAKAAIAGGMANVQINLESLKDQAFVAEIHARLSKIGIDLSPEKVVTG